MKKNYPWALLLALSVLFVASGCAKKPPAPTPAPPPPAETRVVPPAQDVNANAQPDTGADTTEKRPEKSLQELQEEAERMGLLGDVFFDYDKYELRAEARERLARNAQYFNAQGKDLKLTIEGHCDERGTNEYNIALGQRRATNTLEYLASLGVERSRFKTISYGEERPFCNDSQENCWQKNRRARFVITGRSGM